MSPQTSYTCLSVLQVSSELAASLRQSTRRQLTYTCTIQHPTQCIVMVVMQTFHDGPCCHDGHAGNILGSVTGRLQDGPSRHDGHAYNVSASVTGRLQDGPFQFNVRHRMLITGHDQTTVQHQSVTWSCRSWSDNSLKSVRGRRHAGHGQFSTHTHTHTHTHLSLIHI